MSDVVVEQARQSFVYNPTKPTCRASSEVGFSSCDCLATVGKTFTLQTVQIINGLKETDEDKDLITNTVFADELT